MLTERAGMSAAEVDALIAARRGVHRRRARADAAPAVHRRRRARSASALRRRPVRRDVSGGPWAGRARSSSWHRRCTGAVRVPRGCGRRSAPRWSWPSRPRVTSCATCRRSRRARRPRRRRCGGRSSAQGKRSVVAAAGQRGAAPAARLGRRGDRRRRPAGRRADAGPRPPGGRGRQPVRAHRAARAAGSRLRAGRLGVGRASRYTLGFPDRPPVCPATPVQFAAHVTSLFAVNGAMLALRGGAPHRPRPGGRRLDAGVLPGAGAGDRRAAVPRRRHPPRPARQPARRHPARGACTRAPTGFVSFLIIQPAHWRAMAEWIAEATGMDAVLDDVFIDMHVRWEVSDFIDELHRGSSPGRAPSSTCSSRASGGASRPRR